jgi:hypothetical protein
MDPTMRIQYLMPQYYKCVIEENKGNKTVAEQSENKEFRNQKEYLLNCIHGC